MLKCHLFLEWQSFSGQFDEYKDKIYLFEKKKKNCDNVKVFTFTLKFFFFFFIYPYFKIVY